MRKSQILACAALLATNAQAAPAKVILHDAVVLDRHVVTLADVAVIESDDARLRRALSDTRLATLGQPGIPRKLTRSRIAHALSRYLPAWQGSYDIVGAESVLTTWAARTLDAQALRGWAAGTLSSMLHARMPGARLEVDASPLPTSAPAYLPPGSVRYEVRHVQSAPAQRMMMVVDVLVDDVRATSVSVWLKVRGSLPVLRLKQAAAAGASLAGDLIEIIDAPVSIKPLASLPPQELALFRLRHAMPAGALLSPDDLMARKAVERGSEITVKVARGGIVVEDRALAMTEGLSGAAVRLMNPRTHSDYLATVLSDGLAEAR